MRRQQPGQSPRWAETRVSSASGSWPADNARSSSAVGWFNGASDMVSLEEFVGRQGANSKKRNAKRPEILTRTRRRRRVRVRISGRLAFLFLEFAPCRPTNSSRLTMSEAPLNHPTAEELRALSAGQLPEAELTRVSAHLGDCPGCCRRIDQLGPEDPLLTRLQHS